MPVFFKNISMGNSESPYILKGLIFRMSEIPCSPTNLVKINRAWFTDPSDKETCVIYA